MINRLSALKFFGDDKNQKRMIAIQQYPIFTMMNLKSLTSVYQNCVFSLHDFHAE